MQQTRLLLTNKPDYNIFPIFSALHSAQCKITVPSSQNSTKQKTRSHSLWGDIALLNAIAYIYSSALCQITVHFTARDQISVPCPYSLHWSYMQWSYMQYTDTQCTNVVQWYTIHLCSASICSAVNLCSGVQHRSRFHPPYSPQKVLNWRRRVGLRPSTNSLSFLPIISIHQQHGLLH